MHVSGPNPEILGNGRTSMGIAATFPAGATVLNAGNAFSGTFEKCCKKNIFANFHIESLNSGFHM